MIYTVTWKNCLMTIVPILVKSILSWYSFMASMKMVAAMPPIYANSWLNGGGALLPWVSV